MTLLEIRDLHVRFQAGQARVVEGLNLRVDAAETVALVGESGSGKSVTARCVPGLQGDATVTGRILWRGQDLRELAPEALRAIRGREIAMVFQDPMSSLNPVLRVGEQIAEGMRVHLGLSRAAARARSVELLAQVGIPEPERRVDAWPHELSGGMRQRVMIAIALACDPALLIADEPTTALDVTVQARVLDLLARLQRERGLALLFITHDLGVVAEIADRVAVIYAGGIVEQRRTAALFEAPAHPYTRGLLACRPGDGPLRPIPGAPPHPDALPTGCRFHPRCPWARPQCARHAPSSVPLADGGSARCTGLAEGWLPTDAPWPEAPR